MLDTREPYTPLCAGLDEDRLFRVLRAAVQLGVFAAAKERPSAGASADAHIRAVRFRNNRLSVVLREDHPNCIKDLVCPPLVMTVFFELVNTLKELSRPIQPPCNCAHWRSLLKHEARARPLRHLVSFPQGW